MVPSQIIALLHAPNFDPAKLQSLEMLGSVGAPLHREHKDELVRVLPGRFYELYGLTEGFMTILDRDDFAMQARFGRHTGSLLRYAHRWPARRRLCRPARLQIVSRPTDDARLLQTARPDREKRFATAGSTAAILGYTDDDGFHPG